MQIAVNEATLGEDARWTNLDSISHQDLADLWASGVSVSARRAESSKTNRSGFQPTNVVMVRVAMSRLPLSVAVEAAFTQKHASVAAHVTDASGGWLLLAFELPSVVSDAKAYVRLMAGLETMYAGSVRHTCALESYGLPGVGTSLVVGGRLDDSAMRLLDRFGLETKEHHRGSGAFLRSRLTVERATSITLPGGESAALEQLPPNMPVYCPFHVDTSPHAVVHWFPDGTPGVHCSHCRRVYAATSTRRHYDFARFDRVIEELAAQQSPLIDRGVDYGNADLVFLREQYLPELDLQQGATFVKSPKGTNKTGALVNLVKQCKRQHIAVLMVGHRRALLQSVAARLGIDCYFVAEPDGADTSGPGTHSSDSEGAAAEPESREQGHRDNARFQKVAPTKRYAVCLDSLPELDPSDKERQYQVVIIDECEQVFAHLVGDTVKKRRREVFARLAYYMRKAWQVVLLDADLNMITMDTSFEVFKPDTPVHFIINKPAISRGHVKMYSDRDHLTQLLVARVREGNSKVFVATNSKKKAYDLLNLVTQANPKIRAQVVTADNSQTQQVQRLLADVPRWFERHLDVLITSPAIGTGVDITFKDPQENPRTVVDCVFGFFEANIVTHFDIDQQLMRVRHPGEVHVWVDSRPSFYESDVDCIKRELEKSVRQTAYLLRYDDDGRPVYSEDGGLVNIWARVLAASRGSKNRLSQLFTDLRLEDGWTVVHVGRDAEVAKAGKEAIKSAKEARLAERESKLISAEQLSHDDARGLKMRDQSGAALSEAERYALDRYQLEAFYGGEEISLELIRFDNEGRTRRAVVKLESLISKREWFENKDADDIEHKVVAFDRRRYLVQRSLLEEMFVAAGLFDPEVREFRLEARVSAGDLRPFLEVLEAKASEIDAAFDVPLYGDRWRMPVHQLKGMLAIVGLDAIQAEVSQKDGKKTRRYGIPAALLEEMTQAVAWRDAAFKREEAVRRVREDTAVEIRSKELRAYLVKTRRSGG